MLRKGFVYIGLILILILGVFIVPAAVDKIKAWHSAESDIKLLIDGSEKTLQEAINQNSFASPHTYSVPSSAPKPGHKADEIWVSVSGVESNLIQALSSTGLCGSSTTLSYTGPTDKSKSYHYATEIEVTIDSVKMSLQDAIDSGKLCFGWIIVPGDPSLRTSDFLVMKYEAKKVNNKPVSQESGTPWVNINFGNAKIACESLGQGYHLLTNAEWMTIARNIENNPTSWTGKAVGVGVLRKGNIGYIDAGSYNKGKVDYGTNRNATAQLNLSNGAGIWDFSGNVNEWINGMCTPGKSGSGFWWTGGGPWNNPNLTDFERLEAGPSTSIDYGSNPSLMGTGTYGGCGYDNDYMDFEGIRYYFYYALYRGGAYNYGSSGGIFSLSQGKTSYYSPLVGFRCAKSLCDTEPCYNYNWHAGNWTIGSGIRTRTVYCRRSDGTQVADSYCAGTKPPSSQAFWSGSGCSSCPFGYSQWGSDTTYKYCNLNGKQGTFRTRYPGYSDWNRYSYNQYSAKCCCIRLYTSGPYEDALWKLIE